MKQLLTVLLCALALVLQGDTLRVGSYNILTSRRFVGKETGWEARKERVAGLLKQLDMDAFGLQEVHGDQRTFLCARFPDYAFAGERAHPTDERFCFVPVVYRRSRFACETSGTFWLSETPDVPGSRSWDSSEPRICTYAVLKDRTDGRRFVFANTHLDHKGSQARANGAKVIVGRLKKFDLPIMLMGDHNSNELEEAAKAFQATLDNALNVSERTPEGSWRTVSGFRWRDKEVSAAEALAMPAAIRNAYLGSFDGKPKDEKPKEDPFFVRCGGNRIDFIYVARGTRVHDYRTVNDIFNAGRVYPSDHFPIVATVEFGTKRQ